ncbi:MAG: ABC transporter permease, partial [Longimicrobiales bacterium]
MMDGTWSGMRYAARGLLRAPTFTIAAAVTLGLAIGANASIFSVVQGVLLKPLAFRDSDRLASVGHTAPGLGYDDFGVSPGTYSVYRDHGGVFESSGMYQAATVNVTGDDAPPDRVDAALATHDLFATLGVPASLGRSFDAAEDGPGGPKVVMLSHALWRERFGSDPGVIGKSLRVDGVSRTVVGVMPRDFIFPSPQTKLWLPLALDSAGMRSPGNFSFNAIARLRPGSSAARADVQLRPMVQRILEEFGGGGGDFAAFVNAGKLAPLVKSLKQQVVGEISRPLWILLGTVIFVFLIACANVTNLFLVRAEARQKEMAVRAALGAGRSGLIRHYLSESALIAVAGGIIGLGLAWVGLRALLAAAPPGIPRLSEISIDPMVLAFTFGVTGVAAVLLAVVPAIRLTSPNLMAGLSRSGRGSTAGRQRHRARQFLVVLQTALALVLLIGSGLMVRSFQKMRALDPGFSARDALTFRLTLPESSYADAARVELFHRQLLEKLRALPGVQGAGASTHLPLSTCCPGTAHVVEDHPVEPGTLPPMFWYAMTAPGYFDALGISLIEGRTFTVADADTASRVIVVSEPLARRFWPNYSALGKRIRFSGDTTARAFRTIVGVVGGVLDRDLEEEASELVYYPLSRREGTADATRSMSYVVRGPGASALAPLVRREVWSLDSNLPIASTATMEEVLDESMVRTSFTMLALVVAAVIALFLGAIGLYGVISYLVTQRMGEIGIRLALGARPGQVRGMVVRQGVQLAALGLAIGFGGALGLTPLMKGILYGTEPTDAATFAVVSLLLAGFALLA